jgi:hypothetical protein
MVSKGDEAGATLSERLRKMAENSNKGFSAGSTGVDAAEAYADDRLEMWVGRQVGLSYATDFTILAFIAISSLRIGGDIARSADTYNSKRLNHTVTAINALLLSILPVLFIYDPNENINRFVSRFFVPSEMIPDVPLHNHLDNVILNLFYVNITLKSALLILIAVAGVTIGVREELRIRREDREERDRVVRRLSKGGYVGVDTYEVRPDSYDRYKHFQKKSPKAQ